MDSLRTVFYLSASNAINAGLGLLWITLAARIVSVRDLGLASATISLIALLASVANLGLGIGLARFRHRYAAEYDALVLTAFVVSLGTGACLALGMFVLLSQGSTDRFALTPPLLALGILVTVICGLLDSIAVADRDSGKVLLRNVAMNGLRVVLLVLVVRDANGLALTTIVALGVSAVVVIPMRPEFRARPRFVPLPRTLVAYSLKQYVVTWAFNTPNYLLPIVVYFLLGPVVAGYFVVAWGIAYLLCTVGDAAATAVLTEGVIRNADVRRLAVTTIAYVGIPLTLVVALAELAAPVLVVLLGREFAEGMLPYFRVLVLAAIPYLLVTVAIGWLRIRMDALWALTLAAVSGLGACLGVFALEPIAGTMAPAWAWTVSNVVAATFAIIAIRPLGKVRTE